MELRNLFPRVDCNANCKPSFMPTESIVCLPIKLFKVIVGHIFEALIKRFVFHPISVKFCLYVL